MRSLPALTLSLAAACHFPQPAAAQPFQQGRSYYPSPGPAIYNVYPPTPYLWGRQPGFYNAAPYAPVYPQYPGAYAPPGMVYSSPVPMGGGTFSVTRGNTRFNFWKAPSGYYYPWCAQPYAYGLGYAPTVIYMQQGQQAPAAAQPPVATMIGDMKKYLVEAKEKGQLSEPDYRHLSLRLGDISKLEEDSLSNSGGSPSPEDDQDIRSKLNELGLEISRAIK